ncbi:MAG: tandem-95 repeat protein, partial [Planctomycetales bacterium]|nr:tandem-95 repeat protein [Planctomycetales bacterium]
MRLFRAWESFFGLMGYLRRNRRQRKAVLAKRRNLRRRHRLEALEQRVVLNADAVDDTFSVGYGESMLVAAEDLRGNDQFGANPVVAPSFGTTTQGGTIVENYDGTFQYSPAAGFSGTDSFTYSLNDDDGTPDTATVFVHVAAPTNNPPSSPDLYFNVNERSVLSASSGALLSAASDAEGDPLSIVPFSGGWGSDGYLTVNLDGSFTFDPGTSPSGQTSFGFQISDGVNEPIWRTAYITIDEAYDENPSPTSNPPWAGDATFNVTIGYGTGGWSYDLSSYVPVQGTHYGDPDGDVMSVAYTAPGWTTVYPGQQHSYAYTVTDSYGNQAWATVFINIVEEAPPQPSNNAPYTAGVTYASIYEDTTLSLQAGDPEGDALQLVVVTPPQCGSLSIDGNGVVTYTPNGDFYGTDSFAYYVSDGNSNSGTDFVTVYVNGVGDLPSAADDEYSVDEDGVLSAGGNGVLANDSDADGDALYAVLIAGPSNAQSFTLNSDGSFQYVPTADWNGTDGFQYQAVAADGTSSVVNVTIHVAAVNDAPFPYHIGTINVAEDGSAAIDTSVLVGDTTDAEGGPLAFAGFGLPQHGTISGDAENGYFYTPHADYHGPDSVTYFITDGENTGEGTLYFNVLPVNDAPIARADVLTTGVGTALTFGQLSLTANDTDIDGDNLSVGGLYGHPSHGSVAWHSDGSFTYTPDAGFAGLDSFRYDVTDGQLESRATVWIEVGPLVVLQSGVTTLALAEDSSAALRLTRDRVDGQTATHFRLSVTGGTLSRNGQPLTSTTNITAADAIAGFTFSPAANFSGPVTLTITPGNIVSGSFTANSTGAKTATIHVAAVNDAPTISGPAALQVVDASATLLFNTGSGRVITVADVEPGNKQLSISVNHGTVAFGSGAASQNLTFTGDVATVNQQLKTLRYTAPSSWAGPVQLTVTINDTDTTGGGALSASKTVDIRVRPTITVVGGSIGEGDAAGHLAFTIALSAPTDQAVSVNYATSHGSATAGDYESASGTLVFAPNETTKIVYVAVTSDVIAEYAETVYLSLSSAVNAVVTTNSAAGTITDDDPDPVVFVEATEVAEHVGMAVVRVRLSGVSEKSVSVNWSVGGGTAVNPNDYGHEYVPAYDLPWSYTMYHMVREWDELIGQHYEVNAYDYTIPHTGYWVHTTFDGEGVEYNHNPPYFVETSVWDPTWGIAYEGSNDETIHVEAFSTTTGPDPAWANGYTVVDDYVHRSESIDTPDPSQYWGAGFTVAYTWDATGSDYFPESWNPVGSLSGTLYFNPGQTEATFEIYVRDDDESEADETIGVDLDSPSNAVLNAGSDGQITIVDNDTPRAPDAANRTFGINEDQMLSIDAAHGVLAGVSDPDGDAFSVTGYSTPQHGTLAMNAAGDFTYTPSPDFNGQDTFTVDITDVTGQTTTITVTLNIAAVNDAPSFTLGEVLPQAADAGIVVFENWATSLIAGPADESDQQLMFEVVVEDADEQLLFETLPVVELDGTLWFVPSGLAGTALLKIRLRDNGGTDSGGVDVSDWQEFTIEIAAPVGGTGGGSISIGNPAPAVTPSNDTSTFWNWLHSLSMTTSQGTFDVTQGEIVNATWGDVAQLALEVDQRLVGTGKIRVHWEDPFNSGGSTHSETPIATTELSLSHDYGEPTYGFTAAQLTRRLSVQYVVGTQVREQTTIALRFNYTPPSIGELSTGEPSVEEGEEFVISGEFTSMPELANRISISAKLDAGDRGIINLTSITRYESSFEIRGMAPADGAYSVLVLVTDGITTVRKTINVQITDKTPIISWPADNGWGVIMSGALENSDYDFAAIAATVADPGLDDSYTVEIQCDEFDGKIVLDHARKAIHGTSVRRVANDGHLSSLTMTVKQGDETIAQRTFQMYVGYKGLTGFYVERSSDWSTVTEDVDEDQDGEIDFSITRYSGHITLYFANDPGEDITVNIADNESGRVTAQSKSAYSHADFPDIRYRYDAEVDGTWITGQSFLVGIGDLGDSDYYWTNPSSYAWFDILNGDGPSLPKKEPLAYSLSARLADNMSGEEVTVDGRVIRDGAVVVIDRYLGQVFKDRVNDIGSYAVEYALVREGTVPAHISSAAAAAQADWQTATSGTLTFTSASSYGFLNLLPKSDALNEYDEWFEIWIKGDTSDGYGNDVILTGDAHPNGQTSTDGWTYVGMISLYDALNDVTFGTNNVDTSSTGLERASVSDGNALVDLFDGRKSWDAPFDAGLPRFYLGYADRTATTFTIPELASMTQLYTPLSPSQNLDALNDLPADTQFVMADYDTKVSGYQTLNADSTQGGSRTLRRFRIGFMDVTV